MRSIIPSKRVRKVLGIAGIAIGLIGVLSTAIERRAAAKRADFIRTQVVSFRGSANHEREDRPASAEATWEGRSFQKGDVVRVINWAGTFKPNETGSQEEVDADYGHTGIVLSGERRTKSASAKASTEPVQIVRIRWAPQKWKVNGQDRWVELAEFEATIHVSYLEVVH